MGKSCPRCHSKSFRMMSYSLTTGHVGTFGCSGCGYSKSVVNRKSPGSKLFLTRSDIKPVLLQKISGLKLRGKLVIDGILQGNIPINKQGISLQSFDRILLTKESQCEKTKNMFVHGKAWLNNVHYYIIFSYETKKEKIQTEESF